MAAARRDIKPSMDLSLLAEKEKRILDSIAKMQWDAGNAEDSKYHPIYQQYREIHFEYASLSPSNLEALKRAIFIQWFSFSEPSPLSGISELDPTSMEIALKALDVYLTSEPMDDELEWMLTHYINVLEYPFMQNPLLHAIDSFVNQTLKRHNSPFCPSAINRDHMAKRGGMGHYWNSLSILS